MCNRRNAPPPQPFNKDNIVNGKIVWGTLEFIPKSIVTTIRRRFCRFHNIKDYLNFIQSGTPSTDHISFSWGYGSSTEFMDILPISTVQSFVMNLNYTILTKVEAVNYPQNRK